LKNKQKITTSTTNKLTNEFSTNDKEFKFALLVLLHAQSPG